MPDGIDKKQRRTKQNRDAQRRYRERKSLAKKEQDKRNVEPVITPCGIMGVSNQHDYEYANEGFDTAFMSSPIGIDPAPNSSPNFTVSPFRIHSSQEEQQIQTQDQPTTPISLVNSQSNHEMQDFLQAPVAIASTYGWPDSLLSGQSFSNPQPIDTFNPYWVDAPQSGSSNGFQGAAYSKNPHPTQQLSNNPFLEIMTRAMESKYRI